MADTKTFGVKVPEELHQEATELQKKLGLTGEGFLEELVRTYKIEKTKEQVPAVAEDLKELKALTSRIDSVYLNIAYRIDTLNKVKDAELQEQLQKKDNIIYDLQAKIEKLQVEKTEIGEVYNDTVNQNKEYLKRVNELTENNSNIKALIEEYKSKNDTLTGIIEEYKGYKTENEAVKELLADAQARNVELSNDSKDKNYTIDKLNTDIEKLNSENQKALNVLNNKYQEEIELLNTKAAFAKEKAILDLQKDFNIKLQIEQEKIQKQQEEFNSKINAYQAKHKSLLDELEQERKHKTKKAPASTR